MKILFTLIIFLAGSLSEIQNGVPLPEGKEATIVLTYDDGLTSQLNIAIPQLDKAGLKGTFFLNAPASEQHIDRWRAASENGHELGNHTVYHPCHSSKFPADSHYHAENYTVKTILREISVMNKFLYSIDKKSTHSYAYPCCETSVGGESYVEALRKSGFVNYARTCATSPLITDIKTLDSFLVPCKSFSSTASGDDLIDFVKQVQQSKGMGVFIFHGVGGDYLEVTSEAHQQLVQYLNDNRQKVWVTTFTEAMDFVTKDSKK